MKINELSNILNQEETGTCLRFFNIDNQPHWGYTFFMEKRKILQVVVETPEFIKQASTCMDDKSRKLFVDYIAENPMKGDLIIGTGGARKLRWSPDSNRGKSGGVRIIYYYHNQNIPIFLFTVYGKNQKANLLQSERNTLKTIIKKLIDTYGEPPHE